MREVWKFYKDTCYKNGHRTNGHYWEVSNYGRVKRDFVLYEPPISGAYKRIINICLHRIVAELFLPNPENKPCIDHINGNTLDNRITNLRWVTYKENMNNPNTKEKLGKKLKGIKYTEERKQQISIIQKEIQNRPEVKKKKSESQKLSWQKKKMASQAVGPL